MPSPTRHPFERIPVEHRRKVLVALVVATAIVMIALGGIDGALRTPPAPHGIVSFELCAWDGSCGEAIASYRDVRLEAGMSLGLDYLFMPLYASAIALALLMVAARRDARRCAIAALLAWGVLGAAMLDAIENGALYVMLSTGDPDALLAWVATGCATVKLGTIALALLALPVLPIGAPRAA